MEKTGKIAIGCDPNAAALKRIIMDHLAELGYRNVDDLGSEDPIYANVAIDVAEKVARGDYDRGIVLCGTGIGVSIAANKVPGAYAALCSNAYAAERAVKSNNANILALGEQTTGREVAKLIVRTWIEADWTPGTRSEPKVARIVEYARGHGG
jgi:ribose 5-phosphate isomerase B